MQQFVRNNKFRFPASAATCVHEQSSPGYPFPHPNSCPCRYIQHKSARRHSRWTSFNGRSFVPAHSPIRRQPSAHVCRKPPTCAAPTRDWPQITHPLPLPTRSRGSQVELSRTGPSSRHFGTQFRADWSPVVVLEKSLGSEFRIIIVRRVVHQS